jgi:5,10-methylenetetrahydromethanopterin reductase
MRKGVYLLAKMSVREAVEAAQTAEDLGFDYCMVPDEACQRDPWVTLSAIASATERIELGVCVTNPYTRHPVVSATAACTLGEFLNRPFTLGFGAGGSEIEDFMGIRRTHPATAIREAIAIVRTLSQGQSLKHHGEIFQGHGARLEFATPVRIMVTGRGPRVLAVAGELADEVLLLGLSHDELPAALSAIRQAASKAGNEPSIVYDAFMATSDQEMASIKPHFVYMFLDMPRSTKEKLGLDTGFEQSLRQAFYRDGLQAASQLIDPALLETYVLDASSSDASDALRSILDLGFSSIQITVTRPDHVREHLVRALQVLSAAEG